MNPGLTLGQGGQKGTGESYISQYKSSDTESFAVCDMTSAYWCGSVVRGMKLLKDTKTVIIQDEIKCTSGTDMYWFAHTNGEIEISEDGKSAVITDSGEKLVAYILGEGVFTVMEAKSTSWSPAVEGQAENVNFKRLTVNVKDKTEYTIAIAFAPEGVTPPSSVVPLADWK
ncbi:MAG: hypothetical protein KBT31_04565 [Firmicutes bacterium]|nr:hypothetical protein [Candidatus Colimorpha enterica]